MIEQGLRQFDNIMLLQIRVGVLFPIFLAIALAPASPFIALGEALVCLFSTCPAPYPVWASAG